MNTKNERGKRVSATELAEMGTCERRLLLEARYGRRNHTQNTKAKARGIAAHEDFFREASRVNPMLDTSIRKPWCFIASHVFGPTADETELLRKFRDHVLRRHSTGRFLIRQYYRHAPSVCVAMERHPRLVPAMRCALLAALPAIAGHTQRVLRGDVSKLSIGQLHA